MAAATTSQDTARKDGAIQAHPMLAAEIVYGGRPTLLKSSGRLAFSNDGTTNTLANGDLFAGISAETMDNSTGAASAKKVRVYQDGSFLLKFSDTLTQGDVGDKVYVNNTTDDAEVTATAITDAPQVEIGVIVEFVSANYAYVRINSHIMQPAATTAS